MPKTTFIVKESGAGKRLDVFLSEELSTTRSQIQKLIDRQQISVNDKLPKKAGDIMKEGYKIKILKEAPAALPTEEPTQSEAPEEKDLTPKVIAETADYLVIEKPSGLLTHPTMANETTTLTDWLVKHYPGIKKVGDDPAVRPGIVHRLDKEASGLLVVARTQKMFDHLKTQFKNRTVEKEYFALVHDQVARDWEVLNFPIARSGNADRMAARPLSKKGAEFVTEEEKEAKTEFYVEKRYVDFTLLRVILHTGRMHQIRVHFLAYNHPLVGDPLYIQKKRKRTWDERLGRLFLHSTKLSFIDLAGEKQTFESPLPAELATFLTTLP